MQTIVTQQSGLPKKRHERSLVSVDQSLKETVMNMIKTALVATALVFAVTAANAFGREDLNSGYHGNTPYSNASRGAVR